MASEQMCFQVGVNSWITQISDSEFQTVGTKTEQEAKLSLG